MGIYFVLYDMDPGVDNVRGKCRHGYTVLWMGQEWCAALAALGQ